MAQSSRKTANETKRRQSLRYLVTGFLMGSADIVPGVSGGTIAFIAGIYEDLIHNIKTVTSDVIVLTLRFRIREAIQKIPFDFFLPLVFGILLAVFTLANILTFALSEYPIQLWSFFFGLIVASVLLVRKRIKKWVFKDYAVLALATIAAYMIVGAVPVETPATPLAFFLSGAVAISAMILPGISGSFLLLIMGKYQQILQAVTEFDFVTLGIVVAGIAVGLALFSRLLSWLFKHYHDVMIAVLTGLMLGSLRKVWPWKKTLETYIDSHGEVIPLVQQNILPPIYDTSFIIALVLALGGAMLILQIEKLDTSKE